MKFKAQITFELAADISDLTVNFEASSWADAEASVATTVKQLGLKVESSTITYADDLLKVQTFREQQAFEALLNHHLARGASKIAEIDHFANLRDSALRSLGLPSWAKLRRTYGITYGLNEEAQ